ncbi:MAG: hypothetical protein HKL95_07135 [Phycisphaerae bacterium]|nr:hypothetical protein [Phycisphaerae bacterium]
MSMDLGMAVLRPNYHGDRIAVMEHPRGLSRQAICHFSGIDPLREPQRLNEAFRRVTQAFEIDLLWGDGLPTNAAPPDAPSALGYEEIFDWEDGQSVKKTRDGLEVVQWGIFGAVHQEDGRHFVHVPKPRTLDEALAFEPLQYFPKTVDQYRTDFARQYQHMLGSVGTLAYPIPHHYTTCFHWPLAIFGFELLCAAGMQEDAFGRLMQRFAEISVRIATAWSQVDGLKGFIFHDDLTMTSGPVFPPAWYRRHIFPHYPAIFAPLRRRDVPIIFTSDGNCSAFVQDIFAAGADGLNFEYLVDLPLLVRDYPDKILIGNINSATLANGSIPEIHREVTRCMEAGCRAPRFVANIGGGLTHTMSVRNLEAYLALRRKLCRRQENGVRDR